MRQNSRILVTGGAGFIGSAFIRHLIASDADAVAEACRERRWAFEQADICNRAKLIGVFRERQPEFIVHLAAESHVDRSIDASAAFIATNIVGTHTLLEVALDYWRQLEPERRKAFRFHHVSTDEVFGSLPDTGRFTEESAYQPNSPYSASKASADHLVRAWHHTYGYRRS